MGQSRPDVGSELAAVIERMLAKNPAQRFATPAEVAATLKTWTTGSDLIGLLAAISGEQKTEAVQLAPRGTSPPSRLRRSALAAEAAKLLSIGEKPATAKEKGEKR